MERQRKGIIPNTQPKVRPGEYIPQVGEGMQLVRVYGALVQIPQAIEGANRYGNTGFTREQVEVIEGLVLQRKNERSNGVVSRQDATHDYEFHTKLY